jgi:hypothetical protein
VQPPLLLLVWAEDMGNTCSGTWVTQLMMAKSPELGKYQDRLLIGR